MEKIQRSRMLWRVPLAVAILMVLFWGIWAIFAPAPKTTEIMMTKDWVVSTSLRNLPMVGYSLCSYLDIHSCFSLYPKKGEGG